MATLTKSIAETAISPLFPGATAATHTLTVAANDVHITGASFKLPELTVSTRYDNSSGGRNGVSDTARFSTLLNGMTIKSGISFITGNIALGANANSPTQSFASDGSSSRSTSTHFNSSNPTVRSIPVTLRMTRYYLRSGVLQNGVLNAVGYTPDTTISEDIGTIINLILDVPPTFDVSQLSFDTSQPYAGITTASVTVSNSAAYYGGSISSVEFAIGNQAVTRSNDGTLSIALDTGGTFTPTVTVTDSRGQTAVYRFDPITVNVYTAPSISFDVARTLNDGTPDDEGTYGLIEAELTFSDVVATAVAPSVVLTDDDGTQTTPTVTWYTDDTLTTQVTWANVSSGDTVYGLFSGLSTQHSYQVSVRPRDSEGTGTAVTQTIAPAFYTVDFYAGGHGIAFGKPASDTGFECAMTATFENTAQFDDTATFGSDIYIDLSDYQTTGSVDKELYDAIVALGWDSDVLVN